MDMIDTVQLSKFTLGMKLEVSSAGCNNHLCISAFAPNDSQVLKVLDREPNKDRFF